jgi:hypothetical protein
MGRTCICCLEEKGVDWFIVEHVLPQSSGKFENNVRLIASARTATRSELHDRGAGSDSQESFRRQASALQPKTNSFAPLGLRDRCAFGFARHLAARAGLEDELPSVRELGDEPPVDAQHNVAATVPVAGLLNSDQPLTVRLGPAASVNPPRADECAFVSV